MQSIQLPKQRIGVICRYYVAIGDPISMDQYIAEYRCDNKLYQLKSLCNGVIKSLDIPVHTSTLLCNQSIGTIYPCNHDITLYGMCVECGTDISKLPKQHNHQDKGDTSTAHKTMVSGKQLHISTNEFNKQSQRNTIQLIQSNKLMCILDIDHTILHATMQPNHSIDPPNNQSDIYTFQLDTPHNTKQIHYIKLRPYLNEFLSLISTIYDCYVYTLGTRVYASEVLKIIDPQNQYFHERIVAGDDYPDERYKYINYIHPIDIQCVVIIDDRIDVWKNLADNVIQAAEYRYWIGGIETYNKHKQQSYTDTMKQTQHNNNTNKQNSTSTISPQSIHPIIMQTDVGNTNNDNTNTNDTIDTSTSSTATIDSTSFIVPTLPVNKRRRASSIPSTATDISAGESEQISTNTSNVTAIKQTSDNILLSIQSVLIALHTLWYQQYHQTTNTNATNQSIPLDNIPNVSSILSHIRRTVLHNCNLCFTGVIPKGTTINNADEYKLGILFGSNVNDTITSDTTHVIAPNVGTQKLVDAQKFVPQPYIVHIHWLYSSIFHYQRADELLYQLIDKQQNGNHGYTIRHNNNSMTPLLTPPPFPYGSNRLYQLDLNITNYCRSPVTSERLIDLYNIIPKHDTVDTISLHKLPDSTPSYTNNQLSSHKPSTNGSATNYNHNVGSTTSPIPIQTRKLRRKKLTQSNKSSNHNNTNSPKLSNTLNTTITDSTNNHTLAEFDMDELERMVMDSVNQT